MPVVSLRVIFLLEGAAELFGGGAVAEEEPSFCDSQTPLVAQGHVRDISAQSWLIPPKSHLRAGFGVFSDIHFL